MRFLEHQINGAMWLHGRHRALLGDPPGLGKTRTVLAALEEADTIAVVGPAIAMPVWRSEAALIDRDPATVRSYSYQAFVFGNSAARRAELERCDALVVDESHYCGNQEAKRTVSVFGKTGLATQFCGSVICTSGTPMARNPSHLYPLFRSQVPHLLDVVQCQTFMEWVEMTCDYEFRKVPGAGPWTKPRLHVRGAKDEAMVHRLLTQPYLGHPAYMLRRTEADANLSLPPLWIQWRKVAVNTSLVDMTIKGLPVAIREQLRKLPTQLANDPRANTIRYALEIAKIDAVMPGLCDEIQDDLAAGCVIVAHHHAGMDAIAHALTRAGLSFVRLDGSTPQTHRDELRRKFQASEVTVFLGSIGAMQTSLTLTRAHRIVIFSPGWTGDSNVQVVKRIHRISQTHACRAELLVAAGTLEEAVMRQVEAEIAMSESIIDGGARPIRESHSEW